jgi:hypothetical protein
LVGFIILLGTGIYTCDAQQTPNESTEIGELKLEGKYIQRLILSRKDRKKEKFDKPAEIIRLPVGEYQLMESHLEGGYTCYGNFSNNNWIKIIADKQAVLKVGAPLTKIIDVKRQGRVLQLNYKLLGAGGEKYTNADRSKPPIFIVYKGDKEIASGKFEFG